VLQSAQLVHTTPPQQEQLSARLRHLNHPRSLVHDRQASQQSCLPANPQTNRLLYQACSQPPNLRPDRPSNQRLNLLCILLANPADSQQESLRLPQPIYQAPFQLWSLRAFQVRSLPADQVPSLLRHHLRDPQVSLQQNHLVALVCIQLLSLHLNQARGRRSGRAPNPVDGLVGNRHRPQAVNRHLSRPCSRPLIQLHSQLQARQCCLHHSQHHRRLLGRRLFLPSNPQPNPLLSHPVYQHRSHPMVRQVYRPQLLRELRHLSRHANRPFNLRTNLLLILQPGQVPSHRRIRLVSHLCDQVASRRLVQRINLPHSLVPRQRHIPPEVRRGLLPLYQAVSQVLSPRRHRRRNPLLFQVLPQQLSPAPVLLSRLVHSHQHDQLRNQLDNPRDFHQPNQ
jgi:hypothetical protein